MKLMTLSWVMCLLMAPLTPLIINEIHPAPAGSEPEWVEIYNPCGLSVNFKKISISDSKTPKVLPEFNLNKDEFCIITRDTSQFKAIRKLPTGLKLIQLALPSFNNDADCVVIRDSLGITIDSIAYDSKILAKGKSLERRFSRINALYPGNFAPSQAPDTATPGKPNSIAEKNNLLSSALNSIPAGFKIELINNSCDDIAKLPYTFSCDFNRDSISQTEEIIFKDTIPLIKAGEICPLALLSSTIDNFLKDSNQCRIVFSSQKAESGISLYESAEYSKPVLPETILINEIMFDVSAGRSEYIELYNTSKRNINLLNWGIYDAACYKSKKGFIIKDAGFEIPGESYCLIYKDSSIFHAFPSISGLEHTICSGGIVTLNNEGDDLYLLMPGGEISDSVKFSSTWHSTHLGSTKDISLEKSDPKLPSPQKSSWISCSAKEGGTPLQLNSLHVPDIKSDDIIVYPNPFSPSSSQGNTICLIKGKMPFAEFSLRIEIFDMLGAKHRIIANESFSTDQLYITWDGTDSSGNILPPGKYLLVIKASSMDGKEFEKLLMIVIA